MNALDNLPVFEREKFMEQVAYDRELSIEIIDIFLSEQGGQLADMQRALSAGDYRQLYETAHTIKGSLGSLQAALARFHAEQLESAAKNDNYQSCVKSLAALEGVLKVLEPELLSLRESCSHP